MKILDAVTRRDRDGRGQAATAAAPAGDAGEAPRPVRLRDGLGYCLKVFIAVRILLSVIALASTAVLPNNKVLTAPPNYALPVPVGVPGWPAHVTTPGWHNLVTAWERFDGLWYLRIAAHGYANGDGSAAFYPLYPMTVRAVSFVLGGHPLAASLLVSNACFLALLLVLFGLSRRELSEEAARRALLYAAVFPTAFFYLAPYSESLFLLLVLLSFWWARERRWEAAGVAAALAALTRNLGVLLVVPLAVEALLQSHDDRRAAMAAPESHPAGRHRASRGERRIPVRALAWSMAPIPASGIYLWFWQRVSGDWLAPIHQQTNWQRTLSNPVSTLVKGTHEGLRWIGFYPGGYHLLDWLITVPVLVAGVYALVRFRATYGIYVWVSLLAPLSFIFASRPLMSVPRFALPLFPVYWSAARWTEGSRGRHELVLVASAMLLGVLLLLFVNWYYVF